MICSHSVERWRHCTSYPSEVKIYLNMARAYSIERANVPAGGTIIHFSADHTNAMIQEIAYEPPEWFLPGAED